MIYLTTVTYVYKDKTTSLTNILNVLVDLWIDPSEITIIQEQATGDADDWSRASICMKSGEWKYVCETPEEIFALIQYHTDQDDEKMLWG